MNAFYEHHKDSIRFGYRCFDRILLNGTAQQYGLASLRYDLSKLRAKGLVEKLPRSRRYRLPAEGYSVCLIFLKLFDRVYAPLTAALLHPIPADQALPNRRRSPLDRLYQRVTEPRPSLASPRPRILPTHQREQNPR